MNILYRLLANCVALFVAELLLSGITLTGGWWHLIWIGAIYGLLNATVKPIIKFFSKPAIIVTLGLFYLVINAFMLWLTGEVTVALARAYPATSLPMLEVNGLFTIIAGSLLISVVNWLFTRFFGGSTDD